jgi:hypothetical protein
MVRYIKAGYTMDNVDAMEEKLYDYFDVDGGGAKDLLEAIIKALDYDTKGEIYEYIIRAYDVDSYFEESEDDSE